MGSTVSVTSPSLPVDYSVYACEITLHVVVSKRKFAKPYYSLIKPFSALVWAATIASIVIVLTVRFGQSQTQTQKSKHSLQAASVFVRIIKLNLGNSSFEMIAIIFGQGGDDNLIILIAFGTFTKILGLGKSLQFGINRWLHFNVLVLSWIFFLMVIFLALPSTKASKH